MAEKLWCYTGKICWKSALWMTDVILSNLLESHLRGAEASVQRVTSLATHCCEPTWGETASLFIRVVSLEALPWKTNAGGGVVPREAAGSLVRLTTVHCSNHMKLLPTLSESSSGKAASPARARGTPAIKLPVVGSVGRNLWPLSLVGVRGYRSCLLNRGIIATCATGPGPRGKQALTSHMLCRSLLSEYTGTRNQNPCFLKCVFIILSCQSLTSSQLLKGINI